MWKSFWVLTHCLAPNYTSLSSHTDGQIFSLIIVFMYPGFQCRKTSLCSPTWSGLPPPESSILTHLYYIILGDHPGCFWANRDKLWWSSIWAKSFCHAALYWCHFFCLFLMSESWILTSAEVANACSSLKVFLRPFKTSWIRWHCGLEDILADWPLLQIFISISR